MCAVEGLETGARRGKAGAGGAIGDGVEDWDATPLDASTGFYNGRGNRAPPLLGARGWAAGVGVAGRGNVAARREGPAADPLSPLKSGYVSLARFERQPQPTATNPSKIVNLLSNFDVGRE